MAASYHILLLLLAFSADAVPSWPIAYSYSPDSMPIIEVRLAPPRKPMAEVGLVLDSLENERTHFEADRMLEVEAAYNTSLRDVLRNLPSFVDHHMSPLEEHAAFISTRQPQNTQADRHTPAFLGGHQLVGHELTARINLLPVKQPDASLERNIDDIERKRTRDESKVFEQAVSEMAGLATIVQNEAEAQIVRHVNACLHALKFGPRAGQAKFLAGSVGFLSAQLPLPSSGSQLTTNVRVMASEEPFNTVASMVADAERRRDASQGLHRTRILELELKLLQAANDILSVKLNSWIERILQKSQ